MRLLVSWPGFALDSNRTLLNKLFMSFGARASAHSQLAFEECCAETFRYFCKSVSHSKITKKKRGGDGERERERERERECV